MASLLGVAGFALLDWFRQLPVEPIETSRGKEGIRIPYFVNNNIMPNLNNSGDIAKVLSLLE